MVNTDCIPFAKLILIAHLSLATYTAALEACNRGLTKTYLRGNNIMWSDKSFVRLDWLADIFVTFPLGF